MRTKFNVLLVLIFLFTTLFASYSYADEVAATKAAIAVSKEWLALVDNGNYGDSWYEAAILFQAAITKEDWIKGLNAARVPFGKLISRELKSAKYTKTLPGAPDGEYVVIQYNTSFENKKSAVETITPMLDKDGDWRVSGYYIK